MSSGSCSPLPRKHGGHCVQHALWLARAGAKAFLPTFFSPVASSKFGRACTFQTRDGTFAGNAIGSQPAPLRATLLHFFSKYLFRTLFFCTRSQKGNFKRFPTKWYTLSVLQSKTRSEERILPSFRISKHKSVRRQNMSQDLLWLGRQTSPAPAAAR